MPDKSMFDGFDQRPKQRAALPPMLSLSLLRTVSARTPPPAEQVQARAEFKLRLKLKRKPAEPAPTDGRNTARSAAQSSRNEGDGGEFAHK
jgi:hypothetical protein